MNSKSEICVTYLLTLHRYIFDHTDMKPEVYPCLQDEWARVTFADYSVPLEDPANSWVLVFRLENIVLYIEHKCCTQLSFLLVKEMQILSFEQSLEFIP